MLLIYSRHIAGGHDPATRQSTMYYNKHARDLPVIPLKKDVLYCDHANNTWQNACVVEHDSKTNKSFTLVNDRNQLISRNIIDLKPTNLSESQKSPDTDKD